MNLDDYTADAICWCLGIGQFEPTLTDDAPAIVRLLFQPSFAPEVCLTFVARDDQAAIGVMAAQSQVWHLPTAQRVSTVSEVVAWDATAFAAFVSALRDTHAQRSGYVTLDGMGVEMACVRRDAPDARYSGNPTSHDSIRPVLADAIWQVWSSAQSAACRNALAAVGDYLGLSLARDDISRSPSVEEPVRLMILGDAEDKTQLEAALRALHGAG